MVVSWKHRSVGRVYLRDLWVKMVVLGLTMSLVAGAVCAGEQQPAGTDAGSENPAAAPAPGPSPMPSPFGGIEGKRRELSWLEAKVRKATGPDKEALEQRVVDLSVEIVKDLQGLAEDIAAGRKAGEDMAADRRRVVDLLRQASSLIRKANIRLEKQDGAADRTPQGSLARRSRPDRQAAGEPERPAQRGTASVGPSDSGDGSAGHSNGEGQEVH